MPPKIARATRRRGRRRAAVLALPVVATLGSAGCAPQVAYWSPVEAPKESRVELVRESHDVMFPAGNATLTAEERAELDAFLRSLGPLEGTDLRIVGVVGGPGTDRTADVALLSRRAAAIREALAARGVTADEIDVRYLAGSAPVGAEVPTKSAALPGSRRVEVVAERHVVIPPACPDWSKPIGGDFANTPSSNFGCATATNLGLMVANPRDLVRGRALSPADGEHQALGVERYRQDRVKDLMRERTSGQ
jgi:pilus assembly protein CpaD